MALVYFICSLLFVAAVAAQTPSVQLVAAPSVLSTPNEEVTIKWAGVVNASDIDFIAIYSPSTALFEQEIGWVLTSSVDGYQSGSGFIQVPLINMRADYIFRFWKAASGKISGNYTRKAPFSDPTNSTFFMAGGSNVVTFASPNQPLQGHLALMPNADQMRIMWVSGVNTNSPTVKYGQDSSLSLSAVGTTTTYAISEMCASPANTTPNWRDPGYIHDAVMVDLLPSTKYFYQFGSADSGWSPVYSFYSAPATDSQSVAYVIAYGDLGVTTPFSMAHEQQYPSAATVQFAVDTVNSSSELSGESVSDIPWLAIHVGDISYARGYAFLWEYFFDMIQPLATQVPYMVCIGNHEYDYIGQPFDPAGYPYSTDSGGECGVPYLRRFNMPQSGQAQEDLWYSYNYGPIHFLFMSTEHNFTTGSPQYNFIVDDLENVDRSVTPFVIFSGHRPMYTSNAGGAFLPLRNYLEPVVVKYGVNLCLWGHVHTYERTCGINNNVCADSDDDAPVHIVIGMAGNTYNVPWVGADPVAGEEGEPEWSIFRSVTYGYTRFFANSTHLHLEFLTNQRNEVHDSVWLHANN